MLTKEQIIERRSGIGATDVPKIMGLTKWGTPLSVYKEKISENQDTEDSSTPEMRFGSHVEEFVINELDRESGHDFFCLDEKLYRHKTHEFLISHVDAIHIHDAMNPRVIKNLVEIKNVSPYIFYGSGNDDREIWDVDSNTFPSKYVAQCAMESIVYSSATGREIEKVMLAACVGGIIHKFWYNRSEKLENYIIEVCKNFWDCVINRKEPKPINYKEALDHFPDATKMVIESTDESQSAINILREKMRVARKLACEIDLFKGHLATFMGKNDTLVDEKGETLATWKGQTCSRLDTSLVKEKYPEIYKECLATSSTRVMRIK